MSANESFFVRRKAAAAFKHAILARYPRLFAAKAGSIVEGGKVVFLDGYAGAGRYDDGSPGSPLLFVRAALASPQRTVRAIFVERDQNRFATLCRVLDTADPHRRVPRIVRAGDLGEHLDELMRATAGSALFAFLDPFGTALDLPRLRQQLLGRPGREPTELLLHFSVSTIARFGGILRSARTRNGLTPAETKTVARADAFLGGDWWHTEFDALPDLRPTTPIGANVDSLFDESLDEAFDTLLDDDVLITATDIAVRVAHRFCHRLGRDTGFRTVAMPVRPEPGRAPKYILALFTRNVHGIWFFADTLGRASLDWHKALHTERQRNTPARRPATGGDALQGELFSAAELAPPPPPPFDKITYERAHHAQWVDTIVDNLHRLFGTRAVLQLVDHINDLYGEVLGQAWEKHVREAVKRLHAIGFLEDDGTGDNFWRRPVRRAPNIPQQRPPSEANTPRNTAKLNGDAEAS